MREVYTAAREEVRFWRRSPLFWWLLVVAPVLGIATLAGVFGEGALRGLPVAVCDWDNSTLAREWIRDVDSLPSVTVARRVASPLEGLDALRRGEVHAVLLVPRHFERDMLRNRSVHVTAYLDGQRMPVGSVLRRDLAGLGTTFWQKYHADALERGGTAPRAAQELSTTVTLDTRSPGNPEMSYKTFLVHGFLPVLAQLVGLLYMAFRLKSLTGAVSWHRAAGVVLPVICWTWGLCCLGIVCLWAVDAMPVQCAFGTIFGVYAVFQTVCGCLALFIAGLCDDRLQALMFVSGLASPAFAFSGVTFPLESMPFFGRFWAGLLPTTHLLRLETGAAQLNAPLSAMLPSVTALCLLALLYGTGGYVFYRLHGNGGAA